MRERAREWEKGGKAAVLFVNSSRFSFALSLSLRPTLTLLPPSLSTLHSPLSTLHSPLSARRHERDEEEAEPDVRGAAGRVGGGAEQHAVGGGLGLGLVLGDGARPHQVGHRRGRRLRLGALPHQAALVRPGHRQEQVRGDDGGWQGGAPRAEDASLAPRHTRQKRERERVE